MPVTGKTPATGFNFSLIRFAAAPRAAVWFGAVALALALGSNSAKALLVTNLINVQYRGLAGETYQAGFGSTTYSGAAVLGSSGDTWNAQQIHYYTVGPGNIISGVSLVNSANSASALTLTLGYVDIVQGASYIGTPTDLATTNLMGSAVSIYNYLGGGSGNTTTTHTIGGLSSYAGATANLVVYAAAKNSRTENINITGGASGGNSGSTLTTSSTSRQISAGAGVAYNTFANITLSGGNLVFTVSEPGASSAQDSAFVNGFQLQIIQTVTDPTIATQPTSQVGFVGGPATLSVTPSGTAPFSYQWQATNSAAGGFTNITNGGQITGATTNVLAITSLTTNNALAYRVIVTNVNGSITSSVVTLKVLNSELVDVDIGSAATQSGAALLGVSGDTWNAVTGGASPLVDSGNNTLTGVGFTLSGISGINDNTGGVATYDPNTANLMRDCAYGAPSVTFTTGINGLTAYNGYPFTLVVYAAIGDANQGSSLSLAGATGGNTGSTLVTTGVSRSITNVPPGGIGVSYQTFTGTLNTSALTITASQGSTYHGVNGMQLLLSDPYVVITNQPVSVTSAAGSTVNFSVGATGAALTYQWQTNGVNVGNGGIFSGATTSTLTLTAAPGSSPVNYQVVITNSFSGSVTSSVATLSLSPNISVQPANQASTVGGNAAFSVTADGSPTLTYQWLTNGVTGATNVVGNGGAYSTATTSTLNITGATANQALSYRVIVSNSYGSATSTPPATLTVSSAPVITVQPLSQTNNAGTTVNFSVTATGTAPLAYQWRTNGVNLGNGGIVSGATTSTLTLTGISDPWALSYTVVVTNSSGSATSSPAATLTVIDPPVISSSPASQSVLVGATVNFTVSTSSGTTPFTYIWQTNNGSGYATIGNGGIVSGATSATLTLTGVSTSYAQDYRVILSNAAGSATSSPAATLAVHVPAFIVVQPVSQTRIINQAASLSVTAAGDATLVYQWQQTNSAGGGFTNLVNGGPVSGATSSTLSISSLTANWASIYQVVVTNNYASATSIAASLSLAPSGTTALSISNNSFELPHSGSQQIYIAGTGGNSTFVTGWITATTSGYWDLNIPSGGGITNVDGTQVLESYNVGSGVQGNVYQELTNAWIPGAVYTMTARGGQPTGGNPAHTLDTVSIDSYNAGTLTQLGSALISSAKPGLFNYKVTYTATGSETGDGRVVVAYHVPSGNGTGGMWVDDYAITMSTDPLITSEPASVTNSVGSTNSFAVTAGGATLSYQWQANGGSGYTNLSNGGNISGATSSVLTIAGATGNEGISYQVIVSNSFNVVTSTVATLTLPPAISTEPAALTAILVGGSASLNVVADGSPTVTYQWQANGGSGYTNVPNAGAFSGATTPTLNITGATANQSLTYQVVVANGVGSVTSSPAVVAVSSSPVITVEPLSQTNNVGSTVNFSVTATGTAPLAYQWRTNGVNIGDGGIVSGSATSTLTLAGISDPWALSYTVIVTNSSGSATSSPALLTVIDPPVITVPPASTSVTLGGTVNFTVTATGSTPFSYQWQTNGVNVGNGGVVSGATSGTLTLTGVTTNYALNYQVILSNAAGSATSTPAATLTVHIPPTITTQPVSAYALPGGTASFGVVATGDPTLTYQWRSGPSGGPFTNISDNAEISGSATSALTINNVNVPLAISYQVVVANSYGSVTSSAAALSTATLVNVQFRGGSGAPGGVGNPQTGAAILGAPGDSWNQDAIPYYVQSATPINGASLNTAAGSSSGLTLTVGANSSNPVYGSTHANTTDNTTSNLMDTDIEVFNYVTVNPYFDLTLGGLSGKAGQPFTLVVYAAAPSAGTETLTMTSGGTGGNTGSALTTSSTSQKLSDGIGVAYNTFTGTLTGGNLTVHVTGLGTATYGVGSYVEGLQLQVQNPDPTITTNPVSVTAVGGTTATFTVAATGSATLAYQWQATNSASGGWTNLADVAGVVSGSQGNVLTLTGVTANEALTYQAVVSNGSGSVTSAPASLAVLSIPIITSEPASETVLSGSTVTFNVGATGVGTLAYQWQVNNGAGYVNLTDAGIVSGSATSALTLTGVTTNLSSYTYQVIVTNVNGSATSAPALLTVLPSSQLIDVDIGTGAGTQTGAAILGQSGDTWNVVSQGTISSVVNAANITLGGVTIGDSAAGNYSSSGPSVDAATAALMTDFNYNTPGNGPVPVTITGLGLYTNSVFTLVVYAGMDPGQPCTENITTGASGGNTASTLNTTSATRKLSDGIGVAYNIFTGTLTNGTLTFTVSGASFHGPNGFQLQLAPTLVPLITSEPASRTNYTGTTATFSVSALTATGTLSYQWQTNGGSGWGNLADGGVISGSQSSELTNSSVATTDALSYQVVVSNGSGSVTSSPANLTVYTYPVAGANFTIYPIIGIPSTVAIIGGKYSPTDADGLPLTITSVTGATNGTTTFDGTNVTYTATNGTTDSFTYTVSDGHSGTASQTVSVTISGGSAVVGFNQISAGMIGGQEVMTYYGIPGDKYALDWTTNLTPIIVWVPIMTNTADSFGKLVLSNTPSGGSDFYRTRFVP